jgi:DNA mismatch repair protein MutS
VKNAQFCFVKWRGNARVPLLRPFAELRDMGHPALFKDQQRNPVSLSKNMILTGPNAAGKSTYVRGILANLLLAQTFGIANARTATLSPVKTIASLMRVQDIVGTQSLFEAECRRSLELIRIAEEGHPVLFFLDEPMNATPPTEGAATAMALVKYLATFPNVRLITTTHYHLLAELETVAPKRFRNISMEASTQPIRFTYKIHPGPSFQSIAIEMLEKDAFPEALLKDAIEIKNKICRVENNTKS